MSLGEQEMAYLRSRIGREPTALEIQIVAAEWSEHCSYKSSKKHLGTLPMDGPQVISEAGYDSGVLDVGDGYVVTVHIESHNHPSAVEPYGGAATGVGGVIRDILSAGTRPIAILNGLRFGDIEGDPQARWLFRNAVAGIADYGNCLGIPTVGGEVEFDRCYTNYALVDVAAVGFGKRDRLIKNRAAEGDYVVLLGGPTGRDGIGGSQFASDSLDDADRSAVQIPDPFAEKMVIEAVLEARNGGLIKAMKDLGGGGLACAVSETADAMDIGIEIDVDAVHTREQGMGPEEIMVSESQERMLVITDGPRLGALEKLCRRYGVGVSVIGRVKAGGAMRVRRGGNILADIPAGIVANARLLDRPSRRPAYLERIDPDPVLEAPPDLSDTLYRLLKSPNIASRQWVYGQYDHEVGIRTVVKPGADASVLRLDNGRLLAVKIDGNPKQCYLDPRNGAVGCFEEACRNVVCTGARPVGMVDHLQFGSPEDPEIFWTFLESLGGIADLARHHKIPCVGGKVSLYNETPAGPIKPTPLIGVLGLIDGWRTPPQKIGTGDHLFVVGDTHDEMGGSEYYEYIHGFVGGRCPAVDLDRSRRNMDAVLSVIGDGAVRCAHDCSKGGLAAAVSEMCMANRTGCAVSLDGLPGADAGGGLGTDRLLFSESHSRYLLAVGEGEARAVGESLSGEGIDYGMIGRFGGDRIRMGRGTSEPVSLSVDKAYGGWSSSLEESVLRG